jgi:uncharacterized protein (TIGR03435 family)
MLSVFLGLAVFQCSQTAAQELVGTWQGTLSGSRELRLVFKFAGGGGRPYSGTLYSIDQGAAIPATSVAVAHGAVTIDLAGIGVRFEGKLDEASAIMSGSWIQQEGRTFPLELKRVTTETEWVIPATTNTMTPLPATANPYFEVATIKPSSPAEQAKGYKFAGQTFTMSGYSIAEVIEFAFDVKETQLVGGPAWLRNEKYDIMGKQDLQGLPNLLQIKKMLQRLLTERCQLTFRHEMKELAVYELSVASGGAKLTKDEADRTGLMGMSFSGAGAVNLHNASMEDFTIQALQGIILDRPVIDRTGLTGRYDFSLKWEPDASQFDGMPIPEPAADGDAPPLKTAVQEQLGLKLTPTKAVTSVLSLERIERPSAN